MALFAGTRDSQISRQNITAELLVMTDKDGEVIWRARCAANSLPTAETRGPRLMFCRPSRPSPTVAGVGVAASASCTISVSFRPKAVSCRHTYIGVHDDGGGNPQQAYVSGIGSAAGAPMKPCGQ